MGARIVIAEDDPAIRRLVSFTLRRRGYEVHEVGDGETALDVIRQEHPDLAVLDVMMPGKGGPEVGRALLDDPATRDIPFILLSAMGQQTEVAAGLASGARSYLVKPFAPPDLVKAIEDALAAPEGEQE